MARLVLLAAITLIAGLFIFGCVTPTPEPTATPTPVIVTVTASVTPTPVPSATPAPTSTPAPQMQCEACVVQGQHVCQTKGSAPCDTSGEPFVGSSCVPARSTSNPAAQCRFIPVVPSCLTTPDASGVRTVPDGCIHNEATPTPTSQATVQPTPSRSSLWSCVKDAGVRIDEDGASAPSAKFIENNAVRVYYSVAAGAIKSRFSAKGLDFGEEGNSLNPYQELYSDPFVYTLSNGALRMYYRTSAAGSNAYAIASASGTTGRQWTQETTLVQNVEQYAVSPSALHLTSGKTRLYYVVGTNVKSTTSMQDELHYYDDEGVRASNAGGAEVFTLGTTVFMACHSPGLIGSQAQASVYTLASSNEGVAFGPSDCAEGQFVLGPGPSGSLDEQGARNPSFLVIDSTHARVYYDGKDAAGTTRILSALCTYTG